MPDRVLQLGLDDEQGSDTYLAVDPICAAMVRRQRTRRNVVPVSAWRHGDRCTRSPFISERVHGQHGLVSVAGWSHGLLTECPSTSMVCGWLGAPVQGHSSRSCARLSLGQGSIGGSATNRRFLTMRVMSSGWHNRPTGIVGRDEKSTTHDA